MNGTRQQHGTVEVGPSPRVASTPVGSEIDTAPEERCATVVDWHMSKFLEIASGLMPELGSMMARIMR